MINTILNKIDAANPKFVNTPLEQWSLTPATSKGAIGEEIAETILKDAGFTVGPRQSKEHDRIVDGKKVEIKTAFEKKDEDSFVFYGYDAATDPHYWLYQLVTPTVIYLFKMDRKQMAEIYLGNSRKNQMFTTTVDQMEEVGELVGSYLV